jgi:ubiquinone biosynthesis monooxygenase Coq7
LKRLPHNDEKSRAIVAQMQIDEAGHASTAMAYGGAELPAPVKLIMKLGSNVMTRTAYWV